MQTELKGIVRMGFEDKTKVEKKCGNKKIRARIGDQTCDFRSLGEHNLALVLQRWVEDGALESWEYEPKKFDFMAALCNRANELDKLAAVAETVDEIKVIVQEQAELFVKAARMKRPKVYIPDFRVVWKDGTVEWLEYKGKLASMDVSKVKRMREHYPDEKVVMVMSRKDKKNNKRLARLPKDTEVRYADAIFKTYAKSLPLIGKQWEERRSK